MKKKFVFMMLFMFGISVRLFAPTHVSLTNNTPYTLTFKSDYKGGTIAQDGFTPNPNIVEVKAGEKAVELLTFSRATKLEPGKTYIFTTLISFPNNLPSIKLLQQVTVTLEGTEHRSKIWAAFTTPHKPTPEWIKEEQGKTSKTSWTSPDKKNQFKISLNWSDNVNEDLYYDLLYEISNE